MTDNNNTQKTWRSKLGNDFAQDFMQKNESKLLKQLHQIRDNAPENRLCADCGMRGTVWASVNLGVFLCMTCGAHHRSLGTHISKPKGCTGTYWWGPDELEQMRSIGNANARSLYGAAQPPPGITNMNTVAWKEFLMDKYVHRKFVGSKEQHSIRIQCQKTPLSQSGHAIPHESPRNKSQEGDFFFSFPEPSAPTAPNKRKEIDLISFDDHPVASPGKLGKSSPPAWSSKQPAQGSTPAVGDDFFAHFGL